MAREEKYLVGLRCGLLAGLCASAACIPTVGNQATDASPGFCVKPTSCNPDPGPQPVNCAAAESGLEFAPEELTIADFEASGKGSSVGEFMYSYTDGTAQIYTNADGASQAPVGYEPVALTATRCIGEPNNHVLHVTGGREQPAPDGVGTIIEGAPFLGWGGGMGVAMAHLTQDRGVCFDSNGDRNPKPEFKAFCAPDSAEIAVYKTTLNMSDWDGVAVWARRAPDSQPLLRVLVANKDTDEDVNYQQYISGDPPSMHYCERSRECGCSNGRPCTQWTGEGGDGQYYCWDPAVDKEPTTTSGSAIQATNKCYTSRCDEEYPAYPGTPDPQFVYRPCTPYAFRYGVQGSYCWDPDPNNHYDISTGKRNPTIDGAPDPNAIPDSPPAESDEQCGDYGTAPLHLTTEWQLYLVPFTSLFQQGWAKRWSSFDMASVSSVRLTWDAGWVDYWIDDLRFYRVRRNGLSDAAANPSQ